MTTSLSSSASINPVQEHLTFQEFREVLTGHGWIIGPRGAPYMKENMAISMMDVTVPWPPMTAKLEVPCDYMINHAVPLANLYDLVAQALCHFGVSGVA